MKKSNSFMNDDDEMKRQHDELKEVLSHKLKKLS